MQSPNTYNFNFNSQCNFTLNCSGDISEILSSLNIESQLPNQTSESGTSNQSDIVNNIDNSGTLETNLPERSNLPNRVNNTTNIRRIDHGQLTNGNISTIELEPVSGSNIFNNVRQQIRDALQSINSGNTIIEFIESSGNIVRNNNINTIQNLNY